MCVNCGVPVREYGVIGYPPSGLKAAGRSGLRCIDNDSEYIPCAQAEASGDHILIVQYASRASFTRAEGRLLIRIWESSHAPVRETGTRLMIAWCDLDIARQADSGISSICGVLIQNCDSKKPS